MQRKELHYKQSLVSYLRFGAGPLTALCFHGYGEQASHFTFLEQGAGNQYTFIAVDLPLHGLTQWHEDLVITPAQAMDMVEQIMQQEGLALNNITLMGYSMGGRVSLSLFEYKPQVFRKMVLLAPDGLKMNGWYWLATQTWAGNRFFRFTMKHPSWFFGLLKILGKLKLVNTSIFKFVNYYIGNPEVRTQLYQRWTAFRKLKPRLKKIRKQIKAQSTPVELLYGKFDRIILPSVGEKFRKGIEKHCRISIIHSGHLLLHEKHLAEILPRLLP